MQFFLKKAKQEKKPVVLDADGLNLLALHEDWKRFIGENVIVTPHMAFYTDQAVSDMVKHSIESCILREAGKKDPWEVV